MTESSVTVTIKLCFREEINTLNSANYSVLYAKTKRLL